MKVKDLFKLAYGTNLELNNLEKSKEGINFVSRTSKNNGVSATVKELENINPIEEGSLNILLRHSSFLFHPPLDL